MNVIVTSGGTREPIDTVRSIANHATGRLGAKIADGFARAGAERIVYLCGPGAALPESGRVEVRPIRGTLDLERALRQLTAEDRFDAIVHSMAVSDYRVRHVTTVAAMAQAAADQPPERLAEVLAAAPGPDRSGKLRSDVDDLCLILERTPKLIGLLRALAPQAVLVGFKLLDHVPHEELIAVARQLLEKNDCDLVLANDMETVASPCHCGFLLDRAGGECRCEGKDAIAAAIVAAVGERVGEKA